MFDIVNLENTIGKELFSNINDIWEVIPKLKNFVIELGNKLEDEGYVKIKDNVWVGKNVVIEDNVHIIGPCIIDDNSVLRSSAYIRENVIIGKNCVIGDSSEVKNSIIFDNSKLPHFNYVGDSVIGSNVNLAAGVIVSNFKNDGSNIMVNGVDTGLRKFGAIIGDNTCIGCNCVVFPGSIIYPNVNIYPLVRVRRIIKGNSIVKDDDVIVDKR